MIAFVPRVDELVPGILDVVGAFHPQWIERLTPDAIADGIECGALRVVPVQWPTRWELQKIGWHAVKVVVESEPRFALVREGVGRVAGKPDASVWNGWCARWWMGERAFRIRSSR